MTSTPIHLLSPPEQGTMQPRMSPQSGVRDFGALLLAHEAGEHGPHDRSTPDGQRQPSSQPIPGTLSAHAGGAVSPAAIAVAPVVESVDAGLASESVELVGLPWRLRANSGLSYLVARALAEEEPASEMRASPAAGRAERSPSPEARRSFTEVLESDPDRDALHWNEPAGAASEPAKPAAAAVATEEAAGEGTSNAPASTPWPERLLRWLPDVGQDGSTAWVRDFRMDPASAQDLVESLQALAREQGVRLNRIVLNGHPIWHSASTPRIPPRG